MANEEAITQQLAQKFPNLPPDAMRTARPRRIFVTVPYSQFAQIFDHLVKQMNFAALSTITGLDEGDNLAFIYHLGRLDGTLLNLKTAVPKTAPEINSVSDYFPSSALYERELIDLLGAQVKGLPESANRYPLQDDWPAGQYPLRKDWKPDTSTEVKKEQTP